MEMDKSRISGPPVSESCEGSVALGMPPEYEQDLAEIAVQDRILGIDFHCPSIDLERLVVIADIPIGHAQVVVTVHVLIFDLQGSGVCFDRVLMLSLLPEDVPEIEPVEVFGRIELYGFLV